MKSHFPNCFHCSSPPHSKDIFKLDTTDLGGLVKIVVRMDTAKGTGLFGKVDDWYLLKVGCSLN